MEGGDAKEIGGVGGVGFDDDVACFVVAVRDDDLARVAGVGIADEFRGYFECVHELHGHGDVGPTGLWAGEIDMHFMARRD